MVTGARKVKSCKRCGVRSTKLSTRGLCPKCASKAMRENNQQMAAKSGPQYEEWKDAMRRRFGD